MILNLTHRLLPVRQSSRQTRGLIRPRRNVITKPSPRLHRSLTPERLVADPPLEEAGFEPLVPHVKGLSFRPEKEGRLTKRGRFRKRRLLRGPISDPPSSGNAAALRARMLSPRLASAQACMIGYFAKISSARLKALSIAASGAIPFFITSNSAMLNTCSASTRAIAGL